MKIIIQLLAVALMTFYACGCKPSAIVKGQVYVIMNSGNSVKMAGVQVFLLDETALRNRITEINKDGGFEPALKITDNAITKAEIAANFVTMMLQNPETKGFRSTMTGADGDFVFEHIPANGFVLYARGSRQISGKTEYYIWFRKFSAEGGYTYTADLQNDFNLMTDSAMQPVLEVAKSLGKLLGNDSEANRFVADKVWAGMMGNYGLKVSD